MISSRAERRNRYARLLAVIPLLGIPVAVIATVVGHVGLGGGFNPLTLTISDYALSDHGAAIELAMVVLGVVSFALVAGLAAVRAPVRGWPAMLLSAWSLGLLIAAAVPTDPIGTPVMTTAGYVHRYASVGAFICLPAGALLLAFRCGADPRWRRLPGRIRPLVVASTAGLLTMLYVAFPGERWMMGLVERLLLAVELALLAVLAGAVFAAIRGTRRPRSGPVRARRLVPLDREHLQLPVVVPVGAPERPHAQPPNHRQRAVVVGSDHGVNGVQATIEAVPQTAARRLGGVTGAPRIGVEVPAGLDLAAVAGERLEQQGTGHDAGLPYLDRPGPEPRVALVQRTPARREYRGVVGGRGAEKAEHLRSRVQVGEPVPVGRAVSPQSNDESLGFEQGHASSHMIAASTGRREHGVPR